MSNRDILAPILASRSSNWAGQPQIALEAVVIQTELLQKTVKFTELCTAPNGLMNP